MKALRDQLVNNPPAVGRGLYRADESNRRKPLQKLGRNPPAVGSGLYRVDEANRRKPMQTLVQTPSELAAA
jgi:hypothetical protein